MTENGFRVENGNSLTLEFTIPKQRDVNMIQKAELWIFPDMTSALAQAKDPVTVAMLATATIPNSRHPRTDTFTFTWKPEERSIPIDLTKLTLKIARKISSDSQEEVNVTIRLDVLDSFSDRQSTAMAAKDGCGALLPACIALQERTSNIPFLVVKYFTYGEKQDEGGQEENRQERDANPKASYPQQHLPGHRRQAPTPDNGSCKLGKLFVNLTEVYGQFVVAPLRADIGDCTGRCVSSRYRQYSSHALVKERVNYFTGGAGLSVCCSPSEFGPLELLIYQNGYLLIVEFSDLVATSCSCR